MIEKIIKFSCMEKILFGVKLLEFRDKKEGLWQKKIYL